MKCQILFSGKNKKNISKCHLLKILPRVLSVNRSKRAIEWIRLWNWEEVQQEDNVKSCEQASHEISQNLYCLPAPSPHPHAHLPTFPHVHFLLYSEIVGVWINEALILWLFFFSISEIFLLTLVMLNKLRSPAHFQFSSNQITWSRLLIQIHIISDKQCRSRSVGFFRSQLIWIYTVCKGRVYLGSAGQGLNQPPKRGRSWFCTCTYLLAEKISCSAELSMKIFYNLGAYCLSTVFATSTGIKMGWFNV